METGSQALLAQLALVVQATPTEQPEVQAAQAPATQVNTPGLQTLPQAPQLFESVPVLVHAPLQAVCPPAHVVHAPLVQTPLWQPVPVVQAAPFEPPQVPPVHANPLPQAVPHPPQLEGSVVVVSQNVPQSVPVQVSVSPAACILYSTSRFASAPVFVAQVEPVRRIDWRVAPAAKLIAMGPLSDQ